MKTIIYFIITCFISTGALMAALNMKHPWPVFIIAFGTWAIFIRGYLKRSKEAAEKKGRERMFQDYMRMQYRNHQR